MRKHDKRRIKINVARLLKQLSIDKRKLYSLVKAFEAISRIPASELASYSPCEMTCSSSPQRDNINKQN